MKRNLLNVRHLGLGLIGLLTACASGDINFPDLNQNWPSGSAGTIQFHDTTFDATEGAVVNIAVARRFGSAGIVQVDYATVDGSAKAGSDYIAASGTLTWPSGTSGNQNISVRIADDNIAEAAESFTVVLSNASIAPLGPNTSATVTIVDNDTAALSATGKMTEGDGIVVNGIHYETASTIVYVNELPANVSDLKLGQVITLQGEVNFSDATGTADVIRYYPSVVGPVQSIDVTRGQLLVMGQEVRTGVDTVFGTGIEQDAYIGLSVGTVVQVSGFEDTDGAIDATRIDRADPSARLQLTGDVTALDIANLKFAINRLTLDYRSAALVDLPGGMPADGMTVRAVGTMSDNTLSVDRLVAVPLVGGVIGD